MVAVEWDPGSLNDGNMYVCPALETFVVFFVLYSTTYSAGPGW